MPLTSTFQADFSLFRAQVSLAQTQLQGFEKDAENVTGALTKMENSISGTQIVQAATVAAEAVDRLGGASKLTYDELQKLGGIAQDAVDKLTALGQSVPPGIADLATRAKEAADQMAALKKGVDDTGQSGTTFSGILTAIGQSAAGFVTGLASIQTVEAGFRAFVGFMEDSVQAAADAQTAQVRLASALKTTHQDVDGLSAQYNQYAAELQATTSLEDDAVSAVAAMGAQMGVTADQMRPALQLSADIAAAWGITLPQAMEDLVKAGEGSTRAFKAHGIELDANRAKAEGLTYVLPELAKHFGGEAAAQLETYTGRVTALKVAYGNLQEEIGKVATQAGSLSIVESATNYFRGLTDAMQNFGVVGGAALAGNVSGLIALGEHANEAAKNVQRLGDINLDAPKNQTKEFNEWVTHLKDSYVALTAEQKNQIESAKDAGASASEIATHLKVNVDVVQKYIEAQKESAAAADRFFKANQKAAEETEKVWTDFENKTHDLFLKHWKQEEEEKKKQLERMNKTVVEGNTEIQKVQDQLHDAEMKRTLDETTYKVMKTWETADKQIAAFKGTADQQKAYADLIYQQAQESQDSIYESAYAHLKNANDVLLVDVVAVANKIKGIADDTVDHVNKATQQLETLQGGVKTPGTSVVTQGGQNWMLGPNGVRIQLGPHGELPDNYLSVLAGTAFPSTISNQQRIGTGFNVPSYAQGGYGDFGDGTLALLHGLEAIVPLNGTPQAPGPASLDWSHPASAAPIVINVTQPLGTPDAIARVVGDALMTRLRQMGVRTP